MVLQAASWNIRIEYEQKGKDGGHSIREAKRIEPGMNLTATEA